MEFYIDIILKMICVGVLIFIYIRMLKSSKSFTEKFLKILSGFVLIVPFIIYFIDRNNIPTKYGYTNYVNLDRWYNFISQYVTNVIGAIISGVILFLITCKQIRSQIDSNNEDRRIQNAPILKYDITNLKKNCDYDELTFGKGEIYNLYFEIENCGLNHARHLKFELYIENKKCIDSHIKSQQSILKVAEKISFNFVINFIYNKENAETNRKKAQIVVYYNDLLNNSYIQKINLILCVTNYFDFGKHGGYQLDIAKVNIEDEILCKNN